jgi:membrane protease YdiL (CAAX protease family)
MTHPQENIHETPEHQPEDVEHFSFIDRHNIHPMLFGLGALGFIFLLYQVGGGVLTFLILGARTITRENVIMVRILTAIGQIGFILIPTLLLARLFSQQLREVFQFRVPGWKESTLALIGLFSLQRVFEAYMFFQDRVPLPQQLQEILEPLKKLFEELTRMLVRADSPLELVGVIVVVAVIPSIVEEFLFRGLIQKVFDRVMSPLVSAIFAGTIFGLYHLNPIEIVPLAGLGVFFAILRYRSQTLWLPIIAHFFNNFMAVLASFYGMENENLLEASQSSAGISTMAFELIAFSLLFIVVFVGYLRLTHESSRQGHNSYLE